MRKFKATILFIILAQFCFGQDIHFTQINLSSPLTNPAATGFFNGWERVSVNHKNQWVNAGTKFYTTAISADVNFLKQKGYTNPHLGFGLQMFRDVGGDSKFGTKEILMSVSSIIPITKEHLFSAGLQFGFGQKSGNLNGITFSNQFNGARIDQFASSMETNGLVSSFYGDVSAGLLYNYTAGGKSIARDEATDVKFGVAYFHANRPNLKFRAGYTEKLYAKLVINGSFLRDFSGTNSGFEAYFNQAFQGPHAETVLGFLYRYRISKGSKTTGISRDTYFIVGGSYRINDAFSPIVYFEHSGFLVGMSYDFTTSKFAQGTAAGGLEFSLTYANLDFALFKRRRF